MIIVSQDKENIINFENIEMVGFNIDNEKEIRAFSISEGYATLGYYRTKERAKEILQEIITAYNNFEYFKTTTDKQKEELIEYLKTSYEQFDVYEMPEK